MSPEIDYRAVRRRVEEGVQKQKKFARWIFLAVSIIMFILFLVVAWGMYLGNGGVAPTIQDVTNIPGIPRDTDPTTGAMIMLSVGWGATILFHLVSLIFDTKFGEQSIRERVMGREIGRELLRLGDDDLREKRKHIMHLTDDGELEGAIEEEDIAEVSIKQSKG